MPLPFKYWGKGTEEIGVQTGPVDLLGLSLKPRQGNEERKWLVNYFECSWEISWGIKVHIGFSGMEKIMDDSVISLSINYLMRSFVLIWHSYHSKFRIKLSIAWTVTSLSMCSYLFIAIWMFYKNCKNFFVQFIQLRGYFKNTIYQALNSGYVFTTQIRDSGQLNIVIWFIQVSCKHRGIRKTF